MSGSVFLSYAREDQEYARRLAEFLRTQGLTIWLDDEIAPGEFWSSVIDKQLARSSAIIVIMSPASGRSDWVLREFEVAADSGVPVFPLLLGEEPSPFLRHIQYEDVRGGRMPSQRFVEIVRLSLNLGITPPRPPVPSATGEPAASAPTGIGTAPSVTTGAVVVPDSYAMFSTILNRMERNSRSARWQFVGGVLLGLPIGMVGSFVAHLLGWG